MNIWTKKSFELATQRNYLDLLYKVYPMSVNLRRELSQETIQQIKHALENKNKKALLNILLAQEIFPLKDSYVAYLKRDKTAIDKNPATVDRLFGMLVEMGYEEIIEKTTIPKETNRQIGPLFKRWVSQGSLGVEITDDVEFFINFDGNIIFNSSDNAMKILAYEHLGYTHTKGLDFIAKFNNKYVLAEAKFLSDFGGHQNAQFNDAITTMKSKLSVTNKDVHIIAILDGVLYILGNHYMMKEIQKFDDNQVVISAVLLRDYLIMFLSYPNRKEISEILEMVKSSPSNINIPFPLSSSVFFAGDNLNALIALIKSGYQGKIDLIYIDPPYNTGQTFVIHQNRASTISRVKNKKAKIAYNDESSIEEYIEFMRKRLVLMRELLSEQGSIYLHIDSKMGHYLKIIMDEIFGIENFKNDIARIKSNPKNFSRKAFGNEKDMILFYAKNGKKNIFNNITIPLSETEKIAMFNKVDEKGRRYNTVPIHAPGETLNGETGKPWRGMFPPEGRHWRVAPAELDILDENNLIEWSQNNVPRLKKFAEEHKGKKIQDIWLYKDPAYPVYPTEKNSEMLEMIIKQSSNPNSIIMDCFAGSGSTLKTATKLGRKWIGADISDLALAVS